MMKLVSTLSIVFISALSFGGSCESDYQKTESDDYAYVYSSSYTLSNCSSTSRSNPSEHFIYKTKDDGKTVAILFLKAGEIVSSVAIP